MIMKEVSVHILQRHKFGSSDRLSIHVEISERIAKESKGRENEISSLSVRIKALQKDLDRANDDRTLNQAKVKELDKLVTQLLSVNESLVEQLSGKILQPATSETNSRVKKVSPSPSTSRLKKRSNSFVPRVANITTAANEANKVKKIPAKQPIIVKTGEIESLQKLHKMYCDLANSLLVKSSDSLSSQNHGRSKQDSDLGNTSSSSKSRKSRTRTPTRISKKLNSSASNVSRPLMTSEQVFGVDLRDKPSKPSLTSIPVGNRLMIDDSSSNDALNRSSNSILSSTSHAKQNQSLNQDMAKTITTLESEFDDLNRQYRAILGTVQSSDVADETERAEELINIIQKLHKKGEQLRAMRSPAK
jgi:hypothetical protein